jgi:hypothetical protein
MTEELDPTLTEKVDTEGVKPGEGKGDEGRYQLTDEEVLAELAELEKQAIAEVGLSPDEFTNWKDVGKKLRQVMEEDKQVYGGIKKRATQLGITPNQYMDHWEKTGAPPQAKSEDKTVKKSDEDAIVQMRGLIGRANLDNQFQFFKFKMENKNVDIPNTLKKKLEGFMTAVYEANDGDVDSLNLYEEAYPFYEQAEKIKGEKKKPAKDRLDLKRKQLEISGKTTGGGVSSGMGGASWEGQYEPK